MASTSSPDQTRHIVLAGNPNCGKTTLFNALTGLRAKVGNYPGVTVERKEGALSGAASNEPVTVLDLPGTYSLSPQSLDEEVARDILFHKLPDLPSPDLVVVILDASNLQRNLYFATQVIELGYPTLIALNMMDVARNNGHEVDATILSEEIGTPVIPMVASESKGLDKLRAQILRTLSQGKSDAPKQFCPLPDAVESEITQLTKTLTESQPGTAYDVQSEARLLLTDEKAEIDHNRTPRYPEPILKTVTAARERLEGKGIDWRSIAIERRYSVISKIEERACVSQEEAGETFSDRLDRTLTHRFWGLTIFVGIMALIFQFIFLLAEQPMEWLEGGVGWIGGLVGSMMSEGALQSLVVDGVIAGVGAVVVFLPQICLLFLCIGLLEDTGYMARAAFLMDRLMSRVGLHGKSFIPMLSSYGCAIPGIMATRTIENRKDRLATILVAPLMSCSARLPVYTVLIAACIPKKTVMGFIGLQGMTMLLMYSLGTIVALLMAWLFKRTLLKGPTPMLIMELPPYKRPLLIAVLRQMWDRSKQFLKRAGTVILGIVILLWALQTYPKSETISQKFATQREAVTTNDAEEKATQIELIDAAEEGELLRHSFAGRLGRLIEPLIAPLGYDWKIGIGVVGSFAAREVFVSTMSMVYNVGETEDTERLAATLQQQKREDGSPVYTTLVCLSLMVFYVFALQCVSTIAVVGRETGSWKWAFFQLAYMTALAWIFAFATYQGGKLLGYS